MYQHSNPNRFSSTRSAFQQFLRNVGQDVRNAVREAILPPPPPPIDMRRNLVLGIGDVVEGGMTFTEAGQCAVFTTQPQLPCRIERYVIPESIAKLFYVDDFRIGKNSQFLSSLSVPAEIFVQNATALALGLDMCVIGQQVTVVVTYRETQTELDHEAVNEAVQALARTLTQPPPPALSKKGRRKKVVAAYNPIMPALPSFTKPKPVRFLSAVIATAVQ